LFLKFVALSVKCGANIMAVFLNYQIIFLIYFIDYQLLKLNSRQ